MSSGHDKPKKSPQQSSDSNELHESGADAGNDATNGDESGDGGPTPVQGKNRDMGSALRSVYENTVSEAIPDEMLDLLGKLD